MFENPEALTEALAAGATIVVPSRQRAAAVRLARSAAGCAQGSHVWRTPDVLPWQSWLSREFQSARRALPGDRRLLRPTESWLLWRAIARELSGERELLGTSGLAAALPRSLALVADWGLHWSGDPTPEAELLRAAGASWERRCRRLAALDAADWSLLAGVQHPGPATPLRVTGFTNLGAARTSWLRARGARGIDAPDTSRAEVRMHAAPDTTAELTAAALWCHLRLRADPEARLLVVVPGLQRLRSRVLRCFGQTLHAADTPAAHAPVFAIEGGQPLAAFPPVRAALSLLAIGQRPLPFGEFAALLRSSYVALGAPADAARLELWLRNRGVTMLDSARLRGLQAAAGTAPGSAAAGILQRLLEGLPGATAVETAGTWARRHAARLQLAGWPGSETLDSGELQVCRRFEELLGDYAAADGSLARHGGVEALQLLEALAHESAFEPATDDVPVTLSSRLEDPVVRYDGIWVCGCDAMRWPAPPAPDAFVPLSVQLAAGIPAATAAGQLELARRLLAHWCAATPELILSYAATEDDAVQAPSGLLHALPRWQPSRPAQAAVPAAPLESLTDATGPAWHGGRRVRGGVRALELQAECPFRAFAELRLDATPVPEPVAGIDPRLRGRVLHGALERLWRGLGDSATLSALSATGLEERVRAAVTAVMATELSRPGVQPPAMLVRAEQRRACAVIGALLAAERERAPFRVVETEARRPFALGAHELEVRLDRVDRLADGRVAIIDYKAGRAATFDAGAERLRRPQLPCYALAWDGEVAAVATVHLRRDGVKWRGAADADGRLPGLRGVGAEWPQLLARWHGALGVLLAEITAGAAAVAPLPGACEGCHLAGLCRIDVPRLGAGDSGDADGS